MGGCNNLPVRIGLTLFHLNGYVLLITISITINTGKIFIQKGFYVTVQYLKTNI